MSIPQQPRLHAPVLATLVVAVLVGCHTGPDRSTSASTDAVQCGSVAGATRVYVEIEYDAGGMPSAQPETCEIPSGARPSEPGSNAVGSSPGGQRGSGSSRVPGGNGIATAEPLQWGAVSRPE